MARRVAEEEWDEDDDADWEPDEGHELDEDELQALLSDAEETIPCPHCREQIHEDSPRCPHCEQYLSEEDSPTARKPLWIIIGFILCFIVAYFWVMP